MCVGVAGPPTAVWAARRSVPVAISIVVLSELAESYTDATAFHGLVSRFRVVLLSRAKRRSVVFRASTTRRLSR